MFLQKIDAALLGYVYRFLASTPRYLQLVFSFHD